LRCGDKVLPLDVPAVMGILNVTPDSFSDGGRHTGLCAAVARAEQMVDEGAAIIDVGGESTRPGAAPVDVDEECRRILPVLEALGDAGAILSADTRRPEVMRRALGAGADMINDVSGMRDPDAVEVAADSGCGICVMHMLGEPRTMQDDPQYADVAAEVAEFLRGRIRALAAAGIGLGRVCVDPGFGFGKRLGHNFELLARIGEIAALGRPVLAGISRKSMLGAVAGREVGDREAAGIAAATLAFERGARIARTHDVASAVDAAKVWAATRAGARA